MGPQLSGLAEGATIEPPQRAVCVGEFDVDAVAGYGQGLGDGITQHFGQTLDLVVRKPSDVLELGVTRGLVAAGEAHLHTRRQADHHVPFWLSELIREELGERAKRLRETGVIGADVARTPWKIEKRNAVQ